MFRWLSYVFGFDCHRCGQRLAVVDYLIERDKWLNRDRKRLEVRYEKHHRKFLKRALLIGRLRLKLKLYGAENLKLHREVALARQRTEQWVAYVRDVLQQDPNAVKLGNPPDLRGSA